MDEGVVVERLCCFGHNGLDELTPRPPDPDDWVRSKFATLKEMLAILQRTYCSTIGVEFVHISDP
jgi:2-oxoglutarate dehydrogenase complex dehydrogenase (E1) component-like enzyme